MDSQRVEVYPGLQDSQPKETHLEFEKVLLAQAARIGSITFLSPSSRSISNSGDAG
jgi:hypothetical protein